MTADRAVGASEEPDGLEVSKRTDRLGDCDPGGPDSGPAPGAVGDRTFHWVALAIALVSTVAFLWMITLGRGALGQTRIFSNVFDLQARAMFHGRLSVPDKSLFFEGFVIDGRTYTYFGIFPSLIRMPVLALTDRLDGRMTAVSMLVAYLIALWSSAHIITSVRGRLRPGSGWDRRSRVLDASLFAVLAAGSNLFFLASGAWVYHEASLWGAAGVLASFAATLRFLDRPRMRTVAAAGAWAAVAWTSRGSVGLAPSIVLGLTALRHLDLLGPFGWLAPSPATSVAPARTSADRDDALAAGADSGGGSTAAGASPTVAGSSHPERPVGATSCAEPAGVGPGPTKGGRRAPAGRPWAMGGALLAAAAAGALVFAAVNVAKFGSPTSLPFDEQVASSLPFPGRQAALAEYDGGLFSPRLIPSTLIHAVRPDLVEPTSTWPFVAYRSVQPPHIGGVVYDTVEPSSGITDSSPLLVVLGLVGGVSVLRGATGRGGRRRRGRANDDEGGDDGEHDEVHPSTAYLRPFLLGGAAAAVPPLTIAFVGQRYLTDSLPLLVVAATAGVATVDRWLAGSADALDGTDRAPAAGRTAVIAEDDQGDRSGSTGRAHGVDRVGGPGASARTSGPSPVARTIVVGAVVGLAAVSVFMTTTLTWYHQRFAFPPDRAARSAAVRAQIEVSDVVGSPPSFTRYAALPARSPRTGLAVVGDCAGLYWGAKGEPWEPIEVTPADPTITIGAFGPATQGDAATAPTCQALVASHHD